MDILLSSGAWQDASLAHELAKTGIGFPLAKAYD
jgi:hypothetical protein